MKGRPFRGGDLEIVTTGRWLDERPPNQDQRPSWRRRRPATPLHTSMKGRPDQERRRGVQLEQHRVTTASMKGRPNKSSDVFFSSRVSVLNSPR